MQSLRLRSSGIVATLLLATASGIVLGLAIAVDWWVVVALMFAVAVYFLWPVEASLCTFVFLLPWDSISLLGESGEQGSSLSFYAGALATTVLLLNGILKRTLRQPSRMSLYWIAFVFWALLSISWSVDPSIGLERVTTSLGLLAFYLVATSVEITPAQMSKVAAFAILGAALASASAIISGAGDISGRLTLAVGSSVTGPNDFANKMLLAISFGFGAFIWIRKLSVRILVLAALTVTIYSMFMTMSRGAILAASTIPILYLWRMRIKVSVLIPLLVSVFLVLMLPTLFSTRILESISSHGEHRFEIWFVGLHAFKDYFLIGAGLDNFPVVYQNYAGYAHTFVGYHWGPHSIYLGSLVETGIIGFALLMLAIGSQVLQAAKLGGASREFSWLLSLEGAAWAMIVNGLSLDITWRKSFWIVFVLLAIAIRHRQEQLATGAGSAIESFSDQPALISGPHR